MLFQLVAHLVEVSVMPYTIVLILCLDYLATEKVKSRWLIAGLKKKIADIFLSFWNHALIENTFKLIKMYGRSSIFYLLKQFEMFRLPFQQSSSVNMAKQIVRMCDVTLLCIFLFGWKHKGKTWL